MAYVPLIQAPPPSNSFQDDSPSTAHGALSPDPPFNSVHGPEPSANIRTWVWTTAPEVPIDRDVGDPKDSLAPGAWDEVLEAFYIVRRFSSGASDTKVFLAVAKEAYEAAREARRGHWQAVNIKKLLMIVKIRNEDCSDPEPTEKSPTVEAKPHPPYWDIYVSTRPAVDRIIKKGNAVPVTHVGSNDDWFATPWAGISIDAFCRELMRQGVRFSIPLAWHIVHEGMRIVATLQDGVEEGGQHRDPNWHSVIHADLYGQNLLLQCNGTGRVTPVAIDWGRAITNEDPKNGPITWKNKTRDSCSVAIAVHYVIHHQGMRFRESSAGFPGTEFCGCSEDEIEAVGHPDRHAERKLVSFLERFTKTRHSTSKPPPLTARRGLRRMDDKNFWNSKDRRTHASKRVTMPADHQQVYNSLLPDYAAVLRSVEDQWRAAHGEEALPAAAPIAVGPAPPPSAMQSQGRMTRGKRRRDIAAGAVNTHVFAGYDDPNIVLKRRRV